MTKHKLDDIITYIYLIKHMATRRRAMPSTKADDENIQATPTPDSYKIRFTPLAIKTATIVAAGLGIAFAVKSCLSDGDHATVNLPDPTPIEGPQSTD